MFLHYFNQVWKHFQKTKVTYINLKFDFMFLDEAERCQISNHFHSFKMLKALIKVMSALNVEKILTVQVKLILTFRNIIQN